MKTKWIIANISLKTCYAPLRALIKVGLKAYKQSWENVQRNKGCILHFLWAYLGW